MDIRIVLAPVLAQVVLTLVLLFMLGNKRVAAIGRGEVKVGDIALGQDAWPPQIKQIANCFRNQFELPVLFYVAVLTAIVTGAADLIMVALAWAFVASRIAHAAIHVTANHVPSRFNAYICGLFALIAMWAWLAIRVYLQGSLS